MNTLTSEAPQRLTILYDEQCPLCRRASAWLHTQPCYVEVELLAAGSADARRRYGAIDALGKELVVVDDKGNAWVGPPAFLACMWATARYRDWAFLLSRPAFAPHAERFFRAISKSRYRWLHDDDDCTWCAQARPPKRRPVPARTLVTCKQGHPMPADANYCRHCGAQPGAVRVGSSAHETGT